METWSSAGLVAIVGFGVVFVVLTLLMLAMRSVGAVLSRIGEKKAEEKQ